MFGMARAADVLVYVRVGALLADGLRLFIEAEPEPDPEATVDPEAAALDRQAVVCSGDPADGGVVGVWHFEKVVNARQRGQSAPMAVPQLGSCASSGRTWRLWPSRPSQGEAQPLGVSPLPRVLERAASKAADSHRL